MERSRRLYTLWNWLVPFRAVAEVESLAEASKSLHVASSALSRSVKLLEEQLEISLFDRAPSGLRLTDAGTELLNAVRHSMRVLDDAIESIEGDELRGTTTVSAPGELFRVVVPMLTEVAEKHPDLVFSFREVDDVAALTRLRTGQIDVALVGPHAEDAELTFAPLPALERKLYVSKDHPLAETGRLESDAIASTAFAALFDRAGGSRDGFPNHVERQVRFRDVRGSSILDVVRAGLAVASLPCIVGDALGLVPLECDLELEPQIGCVATRKPIETDRPASADVVQAALLAGFTALASGQAEPL